MTIFLLWGHGNTLVGAINVQGRRRLVRCADLHQSWELARSMTLSTHEEEDVDLERVFGHSRCRKPRRGRSPIHSGEYLIGQSTATKIVYPSNSPNQYKPKLKPPKVEDVSEEEPLDPIPGHPTWSGSISLGLVNIPVRAIPITFERKISFRMLHDKCSTSISCRLFCEEGDEVPKSEIAFGYELKGQDCLVLDKKGIDSAKPVSNKLIELDKFVNFFQVDPHHFERTSLLIPNNSEKPYNSNSSIKNYMRVKSEYLIE
jgi:hypothetical protein